MAEITACSRGLWVTTECGMDPARIKKPAAWAGDTISLRSCNVWDITATLNDYTWKKGMPRVHYCGDHVKVQGYPYGGCCDPLYKLSEFDPLTDKDKIEDQNQRLKNLKAILDAEPDCKISGYDYSAFNEIYYVVEINTVPDGVVIYVDEKELK